LKLDNVLYESGDRLDCVYFPTTAVISMLYVAENGVAAEIGLIGNDGLSGHALFLGGDSMPNRAVVQSAGEAFRMKAEDLRAEFALGGVFQKMLLRYTQALMTQISQTAVCNRLDAVEQQLCGWLLLSHDRLGSDILVVTHDLISNTLGVRREDVTLAAQKLAKRKLIKNVHETITVIDRQGLEEAMCECYKVVNNEYNRLLGRDIPKTLIQICSYCKSVRDDQNSWQVVESYTSKHTERQFSHGICPNCYEKIVKPELEEMKKRRRKGT
jgi:CRP-like cAMP-binding protein